MSRNDDSSSQQKTMLNVAGNDTAARKIVKFLSRDVFKRREGSGNTIYEFVTQVNGEQTKMIMTSTSGYLMTHAFEEDRYNAWSTEECDLRPLFEVPVIKVYKDDITSSRIKNTLENLAKQCTAVIVWTNDDRVGDCMGLEITELCQAVNPQIETYRKIRGNNHGGVRAKGIQPGGLNPAIADGIDFRRELDFRTGRAFTRFQTQRLRGLGLVINGRNVWSYGSCQFPTLCFVVDRYHAFQDFLGPTAKADVVDINALTDLKAPHPELFTESELIDLMQRQHIGRDSTYADHVKTIIDMGYMIKTPEERLAPTNLGLALIDAYRKLEVRIVEPSHRCQVERHVSAICNGEKIKKEVLPVHLEAFHAMLSRLLIPSNLALFDDILVKWLRT